MGTLYSVLPFSASFGGVGLNFLQNQSKISFKLFFCIKLCFFKVYQHFHQQFNVELLWIPALCVLLKQKPFLDEHFEQHFILFENFCQVYFTAQANSSILVIYYFNTIDDSAYQKYQVIIIFACNIGDY